jgi:hypothetical protein
MRCGRDCLGGQSQESSQIPGSPNSSPISEREDFRVAARNLESLMVGSKRQHRQAAGPFSSFEDSKVVFQNKTHQSDALADPGVVVVELLDTVVADGVVRCPRRPPWAHRGRAPAGTCSSAQSWGPCWTSRA